MLFRGPLRQLSSRLRDRLAFFVRQRHHVKGTGDHDVPGRDTRRAARVVVTSPEWQSEREQNRARSERQAVGWSWDGRSTFRAFLSVRERSRP